MNKLKKLFTETKDVKKASYLWNTMSATIFAIQSAIILIVITRTNGTADAGIFSIAYAVASLMYYVGEYGVRKYHISDINERLSFTAYHSHRVVACTIMTIACIGYAGYGMLVLHYSLRKTYIIFMICALKIVEAYQEVYFGRLQQVGRLDIASKTNIFRTVVSLVAAMICLGVTHNMEISMTVWVVVAVICFLLSSVLVIGDYGKVHFKLEMKPIMKIYTDCLPLFLGCFFLLYVGNAPKYAIDACMSDVDQACYNFIFMPVFAIGLFANFIFNPVLVQLAERWRDDDLKGFRKMVNKQMGVIGAVTLLAITVALTIGCPVLGMLYNTDLSSYKIDLTILMVGGGMLALVNFFTVIITVMRNQKYLMIGYVMGAVLAGILAHPAVEHWRIRGATILYVILMTIQAITFAVVYKLFLSKRIKLLKTKIAQHP